MKVTQQEFNFISNKYKDTCKFFKIGRREIGIAPSKEVFTNYTKGIWEIIKKLCMIPIHLTLVVLMTLAEIFQDLGTVIWRFKIFIVFNIEEEKNYKEDLSNAFKERN